MRSLVVLCALSSTAFAGWVKGTVVRDNSPGEHLEVHVAIDGGDFITYDTAFDIGVAEGVHIFTFAGPDFVTYDQIVHVAKAPMDLGRVDVERGLTIVGRVIDAHDTPLRDAKVIAYTDVIEDVTDLHEVRNHGAQIVTTRSDGSFTIHGIGGGIAKVRAFTDDKTTSVIQLVSEVYGSLELVVDESGTIVGKVEQHHALRSPVVTASSVGTGDGTAKPILGGIDPTGAFRFDLPAGVYDLALDGEKQAPAQVIVVAHHTSKVALAAPTRHGEIAVTAKGCTIIDLYGARPGEKLAQTSIEFGTCENDRATFSDFPYGTYRVCVDNDADECKTVKLSGRRATVTLHVPATSEGSDSLSNPW
jgi:hypothetical protein